MVQLLVDFDAELLAKLEEVAPARSRKRSEFIRAAVRAALWQLEERATRRAYERKPDPDAWPYFDPAEWERAAPRKRRGKKR